MAKKSTKKGTQGKNTKEATQKAIRAKKKDGASNDSIGMAVNRDGSTIGKILSGQITPPNSLAGAISKSKPKKSKVKISTTSKAKGKRSKTHK